MKNVEKAAARVEAAQFDLAVSIRKAHDEGASLRAIAVAAKMSHEQVRRLLAR